MNIFKSKKEKPSGQNSDTVRDAYEILQRYKAGKASVENRIIENEQWWKLRHWDVIRGKNGIEKPSEARPEPTSAWMFNSISNKHADIMDNYPEPNVLPREREDEQDAQTLSSILPVIFERNAYEETYSDAAWYKLKHGVAAKGAFWNQELEDGMGDVDLRFMDILNLFWEPGVSDIQKSEHVFHVELVDNERLVQMYPELDGKLKSNVIKPRKYIHDDNAPTENKSSVVDWYYHTYKSGKRLLQYCKYSSYPHMIL